MPAATKKPPNPNTNPSPSPPPAEAREIVPSFGPAPLTQPAGAHDVIHFGEVGDQTPILIQTTDGAISLSVQDVKRWVHPHSPPHEAMKFLMTCRMAGVNPFLGEAHLVDHGGRWTTIIDKSGWLRKAQSHPAYAGHEAGLVVRPYDAKRQVFTGPPVEIQGALMPPDHLLIGGWAKVYRNDRAVPCYQAVSVQEYNKQQGTWKTIPCTMIRKVALVQALRESGLVAGGWYAPGEMSDEPIGPGYPSRLPRMGGEELARMAPAIDAKFAEAPADASCPPDLLARIEQLRGQFNIDETSFVWREALAKRGVSHVAELSAVEAEELCRNLESFRPGAIDEAAEPTVELPVPPDLLPEDFEVADAPRRGQPAKSS